MSPVATPCWYWISATSNWRCVRPRTASTPPRRNCASVVTMKTVTSAWPVPARCRGRSSTSRPPTCASPRLNWPRRNRMPARSKTVARIRYSRPMATASSPTCWPTAAKWWPRGKSSRAWPMTVPVKPSSTCRKTSATWPRKKPWHSPSAQRTRPWPLPCANCPPAPTRSPALTAHVMCCRVRASVSRSAPPSPCACKATASPSKPACPLAPCRMQGKARASG